MDHIRSFSNQSQIGMQFNVKWDYVRPKLSYRKCTSKTYRNISRLTLLRLKLLETVIKSIR